MKNLVFGIGMLFCLVFDNNSYSQSKENCLFVKDSFDLPVAILKDSSILNLIDSAVSMIRFEPVLGNKIPYFMELVSDSKENSGQNAILNAQNWYGYSRYKDKIFVIYKPYMLLNYRNFQIVIPKDDQLMSNFLIPSGKTAKYYIYGRYECESDKSKKIEYPFIKQEVSYILNIKRKRFFALESYKYYVDDNSFYESDE